MAGIPSICHHCECRELGLYKVNDHGNHDTKSGNNGECGPWGNAGMLAADNQQLI